MSQALGSPHASASPRLVVGSAFAALFGIDRNATLAAWLNTVADAERERVAHAAARARDSALPIAIATRVRLRDGRSAAAALELRALDAALALDLIDVDPARDTPRLPDAATRLTQREQTHDSAATAWEWDIGADLPLVATGIARRLGHTAVGIGADTLAALLHPDDAGALAGARERHLQHAAPFAVELRLRAAGDAYRSFHFSGAARVDEHCTPLYLSGSAREIAPASPAHPAQHAAEIERLEHELRELAIRIIDAQETERRHIARELHDQTGQTLTAAVLDLEFWKGKGVPADEIDGVLANVKQALAEIRNISLQLRPPMLDEAGLEAALQIYLERQAASGKFDVSFAMEGKGRLAPELELTAFRLVQEAVTNILRHAGARHVDVSVRIGTQELTLRVSDNGSGCVAQDALGSASGGMSLGLISMRERAALVGGHCEFISAPAVGSMVLARLPLRR